MIFISYKKKLRLPEKTMQPMKRPTASGGDPSNRWPESGQPQPRLGW